MVRAVGLEPTTHGLKVRASSAVKGRPPTSAPSIPSVLPVLSPFPSTSAADRLSALVRSARPSRGGCRHGCRQVTRLESADQPTIARSADVVVDRLDSRIRQAAEKDAFLQKHPRVLERRAIVWPFHPTALPLDHPIVGTLPDGYEEVVGQRAEVNGFGAVCDAMIFNLYSSTPAVIFDPGDIALAHAPDGSIEIDQVVLAAKILAAAILDWCL